MTLREALGQAIRTLRKTKNLTQEDFSNVSSRTYLSTLERGLKSPTLDKLDELAQVLGVSTSTIVVLAYAIKDGRKRSLDSAIDSVMEGSKRDLRTVVG